MISLKHLTQKKSTWSVEKKSYEYILVALINLSFCKRAKNLKEFRSFLAAVYNIV